MKKEKSRFVYKRYNVLSGAIFNYKYGSLFQNNISHDSFCLKITVKYTNINMRSRNIMSHLQYMCTEFRQKRHVIKAGVERKGRKT